MVRGGIAESARAVRDNWRRMQPYLRDAVDADMVDIVRLLGTCRSSEITEDPRVVGPIRDALAEIDATDGNYVLVAELGGRVVAMLQLVTFRHLQHRGGRCAEIETVRTDPAVCPPGVAGELLARAVTRARELGCYRVQVTVAHDRAEQHAMYEAHGFTASHRGYKLVFDRADVTPPWGSG